MKRESQTSHVRVVPLVTLRRLHQLVISLLAMQAVTFILLIFK